MQNLRNPASAARIRRVESTGPMSESSPEIRCGAPGFSADQQVHLFPQILIPPFLGGLKLLCQLLIKLRF